MVASFLDPDFDDFPRAPSQEEWDRLTPEEQQRVVENLPSEFPRITAAEGDPHRLAKERAFQALDEHFRRLRRRIYLSADLPVYYPDEPVFAPDIMAVLDVEAHERNRWVVSHERRGLDFALEINYRAKRTKDFRDNVERYHRLRIPEYFAYDIRSESLLGWRLDGDCYKTIRPGLGLRMTSHVLGIDAAVVHGRLCFFDGDARLPDARELIQRISRMADGAVRRAEKAARRADELAARLRELGVDPDEEPRVS